MKETIAEANATIEQLRQVATSMAAAMLPEMMAGNFQKSMAPAKRLALHDQLMEDLRKLGITDEQSTSADVEWRKGIGVIYHQKVRRALEEQGDSKLTPDDAAKLRTDFDALVDWENLDGPSPHVIKVFCEQHDVMSPGITDWIADYEHYRKTGTIRHREKFCSRMTFT